MKKHVIFIFACLLLASTTPTRVIASVAVSKEQMRAGVAEKMRITPEDFSKITNKKTEKRLNRLAKRLERKAEKSGMQVDFSDPVDQWLWFGLFGLGIAIVLSFFNVGLGGLIAFLAIVCLVIWIVKRGSV
ncbi:MAG: hypothetical protein DYG98_18205 [Haliscomenobacteraceae bacterium CHB4]|nr:hypothetical protein [Saprospiraceae bacterium]MCE7924990.1 hypothetical protein [Haliscomenobacteraceae bacterium CHB4]